MGWLNLLLKGKKVAGKAVQTSKISKHEKFMQLDPFVRKRILDARESAKKGDVYKGTSVMDTPSKERSAKSIKKHWGPRSYQLTDPGRKRKGKAEGGRIGFKQGGAWGPLRGTTAGGVAKAFRGREGFKESQAIQSKIVKGKANPARMEQSQRLRAHRLRTKIKGARAGRLKQAKQEAGAAKLYAKHPEAKTMFAKQKFGRQFRKAGKK